MPQASELVSSTPNYELEKKYLVSDVNVLNTTFKTQSIEQYYFDLNQLHLELNWATQNLILHTAVFDIAIPFQESDKATLEALWKEGHFPTDGVIRLRKLDDDWFLTLKGPATEKGSLEFEPAFPLDGRVLTNLAVGSVFKTRHLIQEGTYLWEVDVFSGPLDGLVLAEIENRKYTVFPPNPLPDWVGTDVTNDHRYKNNNLAFLTPSESSTFLST